MHRLKEHLKKQHSEQDIITNGNVPRDTPNITEEKKVSTTKRDGVSSSKKPAGKLSSVLSVESVGKSPLSSVEVVEEIQQAQSCPVSTLVSPITVQPVTIATAPTVSPVLSLVQATNGQVYLIQQHTVSFSYLKFINIHFSCFYLLFPA